MMMCCADHDCFCQPKIDTQGHVSTFESEEQNSLSMDSLGHQHCAKKLSPKIALHFKVLCESKAMLPKLAFACFGIANKQRYIMVF